MNPMFGAAAMSLSSFFVVSNALRLNRFRMYDSGKDRSEKGLPEKMLYVGQEDVRREKGESYMKKTMKIEGMMCGHCEASVKSALEKLEGVSSAEVSHETGTAVVEMDREISDAVLKETVEAKDYRVTEVVCN